MKYCGRVGSILNFHTYLDIWYGVSSMPWKSYPLGNEILAFLERWPYLRGVLKGHVVSVNLRFHPQRDI